LYSEYLKRDYRLDDQKVKIIENNGSFADIRDTINQFVDLLFKRESDHLLAASS